MDGNEGEGEGVGMVTARPLSVVLCFLCKFFYPCVGPVPDLSFIPLLNFTNMSPSKVALRDEHTSNTNVRTRRGKGTIDGF